MPNSGRKGPGAAVSALAATVASGRSLRPVFHVAAAAIAFSVNDLVFKLLSGTYPLHEMMAIRAAVALSLLTLFMRVRAGGLHPLRTSRPALQALRGGLMVTANAAQYAALAALTLADSTAIYYSAPLLITVFSVFLLHDRVGPWRWTAVFAGLCGVMMIVRPAAGAFSPAALLALASAAVYASSQILTRFLGRTDSAVTMSFYGQSALLGASLLVGLCFGDGGRAGSQNPMTEFLLRAWTAPPAFDLFLLVVLGVISAVGGLMMTMAYRDGAPSLVASFEYLALPMSIVWGALFLDALPDIWSALGMVLILLAGLTVTFREARLGKTPLIRRGGTI